MNEPIKESTDFSDLAVLQQMMAVEMDHLKARWLLVGATKPAEDGIALVESARGLVLSALATPNRDLRGPLANTLKQFLDDPRLAQLTPSTTAVWSVLETANNALVSQLPERGVLAVEKKQLRRDVGDGLGGRLYKGIRRLVLGIRRMPLRVKNAWRAKRKQDLLVPPPILMSVAVQQRTGLVIEAHFAVVTNELMSQGFALSLMTIQALRALWDMVTHETMQNHSPDQLRELVQTHSVAVLVALKKQQMVAEDAIVMACENLKAQLTDALMQVRPPGDMYFRQTKVRFASFFAERDRKKLDQLWATYYRGALGSLDLALETVSFQNQTVNYQDRFLKNLFELFQTTLSDPLGWMQSRCVSEGEKLKAAFQAEKRHFKKAEEVAPAIARLKTALETMVSTLSSDYAIQVLQPLDRGRVALTGQGDLALLADPVKELSLQVGGDCEIWIGEAPSWSIGLPVPEVETLRVPVRDLILPHLEGEVLAHFETMQTQISDTYKQVLDTLQDIWKVIRFNVEAATAELENYSINGEKNLEIAEDMALGGVSRATARIKDLIADVNEIAQTADVQTRQILETGIKKVEKSLQPGGEIDIRLRRLAQVARARAEGYAELSEGYGVALRLRFMRHKRQVEAIVLDVIARGRKLLGLAEVAQQEVQATMDEADMMATRLDRFPPIYRRLFRLDPLLSDDFLVGRVDEMETLQKALMRWESGRASSLALVGEIGTGKTSLLNCAVQNHFYRYPVYRHAFVNTVKTEQELAYILCRLLEIPETSLLAEVGSHLLAREKPCVILLEHGYELFLRRIGGLEVIRGFLRLVTTTMPKVFWGLSMTEAAWQYLDAVVRISEFFSYIIGTRNMTRDEIEQAIVVRHELSGYALKFMSDESSQVQRRLKRANNERERQQVLRRVFFERLSDASKGNIQIALFYWLRAIQEVQDDMLLVAPLKLLLFDFLNALEGDKMFTLAALMQHGTMTAQEHGAVFRTSLVTSQNLLDALARQNVVQIQTAHEDGELRYVINPVMRRPVVDLLWNRHIFY